MGMLTGMALIFGCGSPHQDAPLLPDTGILARTPILLTSEARAEATDDTFDKRVEGFESRKKAGVATDEAAPTDETGRATGQAEQVPPVDAITEAQLTKAPTIAAFLTTLAVTPIIEGTPSPPSGCPGGCTTYPTWCAPPIKGNVSVNSGEHIYYMPDDESYDETPIDPDYGERYFCTPEEAEAAGFRRAYN
jgi:hypothetical protein